tara:strand:- start:368 stop:589 length:222 start_codon:yes stop_codon:yes gene_type:complete
MKSIRICTFSGGGVTDPELQPMRKIDATAAMVKNLFINLLPLFLLMIIKIDSLKLGLKIKMCGNIIYVAATHF